MSTDRMEITDLFTHLANLLDERRHDDCRRVYHPDVVARSPLGAEMRGVEEVIAHLRRSQVDGLRTQHVHGDVLVEVDGDRATTSANQLVYFYRDGEPPHRRSGLRITGTAVRTPAGWRIDETTIKLLWTQED